MNPVEQYINEQDPLLHERLNAIRQIIKEAIPEAEECLSWGMPTYKKGHNIIHFAANKKHIGIYPGPEAIVAFHDQLVDYKTSKGAIQLPHNKPIPLELIAEIAKWNYQQNAV